MNRALRILVVLCGTAITSACPPPTPDDVPPPIDAEPLPAASLSISPPGVLLTPGAPSQRLVATALDATGAATAAVVTWTSSRPDVISVDADGNVTLEGALASAQITATAGDATTTVMAVGAEPVAGAVVLRDDEIIGLPTAVDDTAAFGVGFRYVVRLATAPPVVGSVVVSSGEQTVAGRVVAVDGDAVTVEQLAIDDVFAQLDVNETFLLDDGPSTPNLALEPFAIEATVGPFACEADGSLGGLSLTKSDVTLSQTETLQVAIVWNDERRSIIVSGEPKLIFELEPTLAATLEGAITCKAIVKEYQIPLPGPLGIFLGAAVVVGAGFEVGGAIPIAGVGVNLKGDTSANIAMGFDCGSECASIRDVITTGSLTPTLLAPAFALKVEPEAQVFAFAELEGGARFSTTLRIDGIVAQAGLKLAASFATPEVQAQDPSYSSSYALTFEGEVGPGEAVDGFLGMLVGTALSFLKQEVSVPLASSPTGTVTVDVSSFVAGDDVSFTLALSNASLPVLGYNVASVRVDHKTIRPDETVSLVLANEVVAAADQTVFVIPWVATFDSIPGTSFTASLQPVFLNIVPLEQSTVTIAVVQVGNATLNMDEPFNFELIQSFEEITGDFGIVGTTGGVAVMPLLKRVGGRVTISGVLDSVSLPLLETVGLNLSVTNTDVLTTVALPVLRSAGVVRVGTDFQSVGNAALTTFSAPALESTAGMTIEENPLLTNIEVGPFQQAAADLNIFRNNSLTSLAGFASGISVRRLQVGDNTSLPTAEATALAARITSQQAAFIGGNAP